MAEQYSEKREPSISLRRRSDGRLGLMGHVIADYPSAADVRAMIAIMAECGVEVIEIQIPFSEPMADGPVFLAANHQALLQGVNYPASLRLMQEVSARYPKITFVFMTYLNIVYKRGWQAFAQDARQAGARGAIIPDLPLEYSQPLDQALTSEGLYLVRLLPPNCEAARLAALCAAAQGFIYAVARAGVTGARTHFGVDLKAFVDGLRSHCALPIAVGFGVRTASDVKLLRGVADMAVIGTASLVAFQSGGLPAFQGLWQGLSDAAQA